MKHPAMHEETKMNIVVMEDKSAGNDSVGSMWTETSIFKSTDTLEYVFKALGHVYEIEHGKAVNANIRLQIGEQKR